MRPRVNPHRDPAKGGRFMAVLTFTGTLTCRSQPLAVAARRLSATPAGRLKKNPLLQAENPSERDRSVWPFAARPFERKVQDREFLVVSFLHCDTMCGASPGGLSKVKIDFATWAAGIPKTGKPLTRGGEVRPQGTPSALAFSLAERIQI